ncbi:HAD-IIA family hydrolase [Actinomyces minihominis]|uniref:HAD-IIA family hydrolase n=1 Tax=Actinomyces minihominis TaxID=2002838 RepID=UPI000C07CAE4|nr:HAD-IIA family hydrolase [Actinomyces minihominis]
MGIPGVASWARSFYDTYIFDLDGTIYLGDQLLPGARRLLEELRDRKIPVRFLSNNPTKGPSEYLEKLSVLGLEAHPHEIITTVVATSRWLKRNHPGAKVYPIAEAPLIEELTSQGIALSDDPSEIDVVIASYDRGFDYMKLQTAFDAIWFHKRAILIGTNPDRYCPFPGGRGEPDCAAIIAAIEACTGSQCTEIIGKPNPAMLAAALDGLDVALDRVVMVGDRLGTDIAMAIGAGTASAMPLTGDSSEADVLGLPEDERPTLVIERIDQLVPREVWEESGWSLEDATLTPDQMLRLTVD